MSKISDSMARRYARALYEVAAESGDLTSLEKDLLRIEAVWRAHPMLISPRQMALLPAIVRAWRELRARADAPAFLRMEVPAPIPPDEQAEVTRRLSAALQRTVELRIVINPELLGGAVLHIDGRMIDVSVRGRLEEAYRQMADETARI